MAFEVEIRTFADRKKIRLIHSEGGSYIEICTMAHTKVEDRFEFEYMLEHLPSVLATMRDADEHGFAVTKFEDGASMIVENVD